MTDVHRLYAITHSLYSGRARAYLIKQGIPFEELSTGHERFKAEVLPKGKLPTIPTISETRDTVACSFCRVVVGQNLSVGATNVHLPPHDTKREQ